jgi:hypothetical protein
MSQPEVAVLMAVYNGADHIQTAINAILAQSYTNFEFIIINDGSTDQTAEILNNIHDSRVRIIHQDNIGLAASLNRGINLTNSRYVARQDHDDISDIRRLEKQVKYLDKNPSCSLLGTRAYILRDNRIIVHAHDHPTLSNVLKYELLFNNPFVHSSVMFRNNCVKELGGYTTSPLRQPPEDYELWSRIARVHDVANLPERLMIYRETPGSISRRGDNPFLEKIVVFSAENIAYAVGLEKPDTHCINIAAFTHGALHRLVRPIDLEMMKSTMAIASKAHCNDIQITGTTNCINQRMRNRLNLLTQQYLHYKKLI